MIGYYQTSPPRVTSINWYRLSLMVDDNWKLIYILRQLKKLDATHGGGVDTDCINNHLACSTGGT